MDDETHYHLVNRKSKKAASSYNWYDALGARAYLMSYDKGIASLLPHQRGRKALQKNELRPVKPRGLSQNTLHKTRQEEAAKILPDLLAHYKKIKPPHLEFRKGRFCDWVSKEMSDPRSEAYRIASIAGCEWILDDNLGPAWWQRQLQKLES
jgi:hypothetical protein